MPKHIVIAGYVTVTTAVSGGRAAVDIPRGALLPDDVPAEERERLAALGQIQPWVDAVERVPLSRPPAPAVPPVVPDGTVDAVLAWVGGDAARARVAVAAEETKGDRARKTLIAALTPLIEVDDEGR